MHDVDLSQRLYLAESDFLAALESGTTMLASYRQTLSALLDTLQTASKTGSVGNETLYLVHSVASRIANLASCSLDIKRREESSTALLQSDCDAMLHQMATLDLNADPKSLQPDNGSDFHSRSCSSTPIHNVESSFPPFLASAHQWLVGNLHNPYPTTEVKARIAAASSCQVSSVNSWFINARRRIGWTTLCRDRFSNCRADIIDAAYRALVEEDSQRTLSPELRHSFVAMKVTAEGLYSSTFTRSALAGDLDAIIKDMTEEDRKSVEVGKYRQVDQANQAKAVRDSYPSPDRFIPASPLPALVDSPTDESEEEEDVAPPIIAGSKRHLSSIEPPTQPSSTAGRPIKRLCTSVTSRTYLPSPPSSTDGDEPSDHGSPELSVVHSTQPETNKVLPSRKRRLSDADATEISKRPCGSMPAPHLPIVSDPLPCSNIENEYSIDDWFNTNFDSLFAIPPPVDATEPDFSASWEVELFRDYSIPRIPKHTPKCPPTPTVDTQISGSTDLSDLDSLLQSIGSDTFVTIPESVPLPDVAGISYTTSLHSSIPEMSQTNIDWTSLLNSSDTYQPTIYSTFPQYPVDSPPLPEIDLSILQFPHVIPAINFQGDFESKQAKLHQLHAMQEAVRRMEQELQSEGIVV
ncbi:homeodomain protein [Lanmaoa asiatica]|nr:homeodomain protein [Lanmaoa asiatica]